MTIFHSRQAHIKISCLDKVYTNSSACLQLRSTLAAERAATEAHRAIEISSVGVVLSLVAFIALLITIFQGRAALRKASRANSIANETAKRQLRAYLTVKELGFEWKFHVPSGTKLCHIWAIVENSGATPTLNLKFVVGRTDNKDEDIMKVIPGPIDGGERSSIGPRQVARTPSVTITEDQVITYFKGDSSLFLFGAAFYEDVFMDKKQTRYCFKIEFSKSKEGEVADFINWHMVGNHNCADDECELANAGQLK